MQKIIFHLSHFCMFRPSLVINMEVISAGSNQVITYPSPGQIPALTGTVKHNAVYKNIVTHI